MSAPFLAPKATHPDQRELYSQSVAIAAVERQLLLDASQERAAQVKDLKARYDELLQSTNEKLTVANGTVEDLQQELNVKDGEIQGLRSVVEDLKMQLEKERGPESEAQRELQELRKENAELQVELQKAHDNLNELSEFSEEKLALNAQIDNLGMTLSQTLKQQNEREMALKKQIVDASTRWSMEFERRLKQERAIIRQQVVANLDRNTRSTFLDLDRLQSELRYYQKQNQEKTILNQNLMMADQRLRRENGIYKDMQQSLVQKQEYYKRLLLKLRDFVFKTLRRDMMLQQGMRKNLAREVSLDVLPPPTKVNMGATRPRLTDKEKVAIQAGIRGNSAKSIESRSFESAESQRENMAELILLLKEMPIRTSTSKASEHEQKKTASDGDHAVRYFNDGHEVIPDTDSASSDPATSLSSSGGLEDPSLRVTFPPLKRSRDSETGPVKRDLLGGEGIHAPGTKQDHAHDDGEHIQILDKRRRVPEAHGHRGVYAPERAPTFTEQKEVLRKCKELR